MSKTKEDDTVHIENEETKEHIDPLIRYIEDGFFNHYVANPSIRVQECAKNKKKYKIDTTKQRLLSQINSLEFNYKDGRKAEFILDRVEVKKSPIHGVGVFTTIDIKKGDLLTFHPGDIVKYTPAKLSKKDALKLVNYSTFPYFSERFVKAHKDTFNDDMFIMRYLADNTYGFDIDDNYTIIGDPLFKEPTHHVGHLINDCAKHNSTDRSISVYDAVCNIRTNASFYKCKGDLHIAVIASKDIKAGQEVFIKYGVKYWLAYNKMSVLNQLRGCPERTEQFVV